MTMAIDKRIKAGVPVGGALGSWVGNPRVHSAYLYLPNVLRHFDQPQVVASMAPRALLVIHSLGDGYVSNESVVEMEAYARPFYEKLGASERFKVHMPPGGTRPNSRDTRSGHGLVQALALIQVI
jgi:hypothetical protein